MENISTAKNILASDILDTMVKMRDELDALIETVQIMSDRELMSGLQKSKQDVIKGNVYEISSADDLAVLWDE